MQEQRPNREKFETPSPDASGWMKGQRMFGCRALQCWLGASLLAPGLASGTTGKSDVYLWVDKFQNVSDQPFWQTISFWCLVPLVVVAAFLANGRFWAWRKMRREMLRLKNEQVLEQERLRIAHDIHDDLGARVTQICLVSSVAQNNPAFPEKARNDFDRISQMSRELVSALYETVWAVNPENDNLEALGNYLCQMVNQLCERTQIRCRFHVDDLSHDIKVSSQTRHNISMAVKEAVHNAIKHSEASEIATHITIKGDLLTIAVQDNGHGFEPGLNRVGHGLRNIRRRLENIGGTCSVESKPGGGTTVQLSLLVRHDAKIAGPEPAEPRRNGNGGPRIQLQKFYEKISHNR